MLQWIERGKRIFLHFTPTSSSWLNMVERFFRTLTDRQIRRGVFTSVKELEARLAEYIDTYNENPQPFVWTKSAKQILEKVEGWSCSPNARPPQRLIITLCRTLH